MPSAAFRWINGNAPLAGGVEEHPDGDAWLLPTAIGDELLVATESLDGVEMAPYDAETMVIHAALPPNGEAPLSREQVRQGIFDLLLDCLPRSPWDTWRLYVAHPSRMVAHLDAQDCSSLATVLEVAAEDPVIRAAASTLRQHCEAVSPTHSC